MAKSLLQEIVEQNGTAGLNKSYVDTALANGGGYGATAVTPTRPMGYVKSTTADDIAPVRTTKKTVAQSIISNKGSQTTGGTFLGGWKQPEAKEKKTPTAAEIAAQQKEAEEAAKRLSYLESLDLNAQKKKIDALTAESKKGAKLNVHAFGGYDPKNMTDTEMALAEAQEDYNLAKSLQYSAKGKKALEALDSDIYAHIDNMALWKVSASKFRKKTGKDNVSEDLQALYDAGLTLADIEQLVDYRKRQINEDQYDKRVKKMQELASRDDLLGISDMGAVAASILSVPLNLGSGAGYLDLLNQKAYIEGAGYDRPLDYKTGAMSLYGQASAARETVSQGIMDNAETELGGQVGSFLYQTGMSMADSAVVAALGALGLGTAGTVLLGGSAATAAAVDAKNRGGSDSQALWSGALAGAAETVFEKISIDNLLTGKYTKNFVGSEFKKLLADVGVQGAVEGSEELFTEFANHITDRAIMGGSSNYAKSIREYMDAGMTAAEAKAKADADFAVECATSFVGGVFSGGVMGSAASAMRQDGGYTTALTENDQKVIDKLVADKIAEAEKEGKKLTDKAARKEVMEDMEKGRISIDTIEEVLGGDEYGAFANLKSEADEFNTLYETEGGKLTEKQKDRLAELKAKNQATPYEKALQDAKSKLSQSVYDRAKGGRLVESYNERARMTQDYVADFDKIKGLKHEDAARKTIESAMALSPNNSNRVHDMIDLAAKTAGDTGLSVTFANGEQVKSDYIARQTAAIKEIESVPESERTTEQAQLLEEMKAQLAKVESGEITVNGTITEDGIVLNIDSPNPLNRLLGHEVLHNLKSKRYQAVRDAVLKYANDKGIDTEKKLAEYAARYAGVKNADPEAEFVADMVGDLLYSDAEFVRRLSVENQNVFQWLWNEIKHMYKLATAGSREARDLARIQKTFEDAYRTNGKPEQADEGTVFDAIVGTKKAAKSGVDYSISSQPDTSFTAEEITAIQNIGRKSVNAFDSDDIAATEKFARRYYEEMGTKSPFFRAWFGDWRSKDSSPVNVVTKQGDTRTDHVNKDTGWTIRNSRMVHNETISHQSLIHQEAVPYLPYIDEIIENAVLLDTGGIGKLKSENSLLMHYLYAVADIGNGQEVLKLRVEEMYDPGKKGTNKRAYILQNIEKAFAVSGMVQGNAPSHGTSTTNAVNTVADLFALVKHMDGDFTPSDASTVVNEDGTPKVMYHGTDGEFTIFDPIINGGKNGVAEGYGLYFTDASEVAEAYGDRLMQTYINIKKPATSFEKTIKQTALAKLIKASCEAQAKQFVSDGDCDSIKDAIRDTWVSNYVYTYDMTMDTAYRQVAATIISAEDHDMGIVQEVMAGMGIRSYEEAYDFYAILKETLGIDGFITEWESKDGDTSQVALAFDSEQVKSATENIGTFDKSNPDINHSLSDSGEQFAPLTDFDFFGKDFRKQDAAPTQESGDIAPKKETLPEPTTDRERRKAKSYEQSKRLVATQSSERQAYLRDKYEQHKAELDALEVGDRLVGDGGNVIGEVVDKSPWGITIAGDSFMESIPTGTFAGDGVIGFLEVGDGHFEKAEVDETKTTAPVVSAENATTTKPVRDEVADDFAPTLDDQRIASLSDADAPPQMEAPYQPSQEVIVDDPFDDRDWSEVGNRKVKAYMYENPEVKPFFQEEAAVMLDELNSTTKGERWYDDRVYYDSGGEAGWGGTKRHTSDSIAEMLDNWHMSYDDIEKGLKAIIEDHGAENIAAAKKIEFMLNDRLLNGYENFADSMMTGERYIPANQEYINLVNELQTNAYSAEAFEALMADADRYAPMVEAPIKSAPAPTPIAGAKSSAAPTYEVVSDKKGEIKGQQAITKEDAATGKTAKVLVEEPKVEKKQSAWSKVKNLVLDKGMVFEDLSIRTGNRELQARWNSIRYARNKAQRLMEKGNASVSSLDSIRKAVEGQGAEYTQKFYEYLYHMHNIDRMSLETKENRVKREELQVQFQGYTDDQLSDLATSWITKDTPQETVDRIKAAREYVDVKKGANKPVFGDDVTADISRKAASKMEKANPEFKEYAQQVYDYMTYLRKMLVDNGVISDETAKLWDEMYPHYVPIRRVGDTGLNINVPLDTGRTGVNAPVKRATGGSSDILPLFDTMGQRTMQTFSAVAKNRFGVELKNTLGTTIGSEAMGLDEAIDSIDTQDGLLQEGKKGKKPTFTVFENGERVTFEITEEMYDAMKPTSDALAYTSKVASAVSNFRRSTLTQYNPWFLLKNAIKDTQDVLINSQHAARTYAAIPKAISQLRSKGHWYTEYMENGGEDNTYFDSQTNTFKKPNPTIEAIKKYTGLNAIATANNFVERVPRLAEYIASREAGRSIDVAMLDAARVTTNFAAGGDLTKFLNRNGATFLNASVQGAMQQVRNVREAKAAGVKGVLCLAAKFAVAGLPVIALNALIWGDDDEYEELSDYIKQSYYIVGKTEDGKFIRIPKGRTLAVIQNGFEQMQHLITGDDEADLGTFLDLLLTNLAPNNPVDNNILSPIIDVAQNKTWYGEDLVPTRLQDLPNAEQYDESTDSLSKWLGETFDVSPYKVNYLLDQYGGVLSDTFLPMFTPEAESGNNTAAGNLIAPLKDMFTTDSVMNNQNVSDFYDTKDELAKAANSMYATDDDVLKAKYMNSINSEMGELYKQKRELQNSDMPNAEKYKAVREVQKQIVELAKSGLNSYDAISYDRYLGEEYAEVSGKVWKKNDDGEWSKLSEEQQRKYEVTRAAPKGSVHAGSGAYQYRWYTPEEDADDPTPYWKKITDDELEKQNLYTKALSCKPSDYWKYKEALGDIQADKDSSGKSINGSRKEKVIDWINELDADYSTKIILYKKEYNSDDTYNYDIIEYLNSRKDISYAEMKTILEELGFDVDANGNISWD